MSNLRRVAFGILAFASLGTVAHERADACCGAAPAAVAAPAMAAPTLAAAPAVVNYAPAVDITAMPAATCCCAPTTVERRFLVARPVLETTMQEQRFTVQKPVVEMSERE